MATRVTYIQTGWNVRTRDGQDLGRVIDLSHDSVYLDDDGHRRTVPKAYIDEEDESAMLAILSIDLVDLEEGSISSSAEAGRDGRSHPGPPGT
jgi:hypothetical protein